MSLAARAARAAARQVNELNNNNVFVNANIPLPPPLPPKTNNQNEKPRGDGKYATKAQGLWEISKRMITAADTTANLLKSNNNTTTAAQNSVNSMREKVATLTQAILDINVEFKEEVNQLLTSPNAGEELLRKYRHLSNCDVETNNTSRGCPRIRNMDKHITEIKNAIGRKKNAQKLKNKAANVNAKQLEQNRKNKKQKAKDELTARKKSLGANINALISNFKRLQKKI
jgi:hypothetical protein